MVILHHKNFLSVIRLLTFLLFSVNFSVFMDGYVSFGPF